MRTRRSDPSKPGYGRIRAGSGFRFLDVDGAPLADPAEIERCRSLVIPPAWRDVWICPDPAGHLQATGFDAAGRRQYLYHPMWRASRDREKFDHVQLMAKRLPWLRRRISADLDTDGLNRARVLALAARLLDRGLFRVGSDQYALGDEPTFGVSTLEAVHVECDGSTMHFHYDAKDRKDRNIVIRDGAAAKAIEELKRERHDDERLLGYRGHDGSWHAVHSGEVNDYLRESAGVGMSAKDMRTWHATVLASVGLARAEPPASRTATLRTIAHVIKDVSIELGNTPTVARASYVDPRVIDRFEHGHTVDLPPTSPPAGRTAERAVREFLADSQEPIT